MVSIAYSEITRVLAVEDSNTSLDSQDNNDTMSAHVDWLSFSFQLNDKFVLDRLLETIQQLLQVTIAFDSGRVITDNSKETYTYYPTDYGVSVGYTSTLVDGIVKCRVTIPGQQLQRMDDWYVKHVCKKLHDDFGAKCTRIDLAVDDYSRSLDFGMIQDAILAGNIAGFNKAKFIESYGGSDSGKTIYLGTRRSPKYGRIYDRMAMTNGMENCIRFEVEYKQGMALAIFQDYIKADEDTGISLLSGIIKSAFDFTIKKDKNLSRATRLLWWESFLGRIVGEIIKVVLPKKNRSIERTLSWLRRSVSKSILIANEVLGGDLFDTLMEVWKTEARNRITDLDRIIVANSRNNLAELTELLLQWV